MGAPGPTEFLDDVEQETLLWARTTDTVLQQATTEKGAEELQ